MQTLQQAPEETLGRACSNDLNRCICRSRATGGTSWHQGLDTPVIHNPTASTAVGVATDWGLPSGLTRYTCSPSIRSGSRLVARMPTPGAAPRTAAVTVTAAYIGTNNPSDFHMTSALAAHHAATTSPLWERGAGRQLAGTHATRLTPAYPRCPAAPAAMFSFRGASASIFQQGLTALTTGPPRRLFRISNPVTRQTWGALGVNRDPFFLSCRAKSSLHQPEHHEGDDIARVLCLVRLSGAGHMPGMKSRRMSVTGNFPLRSTISTACHPALV